MAYRYRRACRVRVAYRWGRGGWRPAKAHGLARAGGELTLARGVGVLLLGVPNGSNCWNVNFGDGSVDNNNNNNNNCDNDNAVRLVRSGE